MRVGLTGGIASGKSSVSRLLAAHGAQIVDHDVLARDAVAVGSPGLAQIAQVFGLAVLNADGSLNRGALGEIVFAQPARLEQLNAIVHPEVKRLAKLADAEHPQRSTVIVHDIPLLVETTQEHDFDAVIVVEAPQEIRIARMIEQRGMSREQAEARIAQQATDSQRRSIADYLILNDGSVEDLESEVRKVWEDLQRR